MTRTRRTQIIVLTVGVALLMVIGAIAWLATRTPEDDRTKFDASKPGDLVSVEPWRGEHPNTLDMWRIEYLSADLHGKPRRATALVSAASARPAGPRPVVAFAHGTVGIAEKCAPSDKAVPVTTDGGTMLPVMAGGAVIVAPDYAGLGSPGPHGFLVGMEAGYDILDAVRAARQIPDLKLSQKTVIWGQSQGGHAALWAGMLAPKHAPGLKLLGVAATAPPTRLAELLDSATADPAVWRLEAWLLDSWRQVYPSSGLWDEVNPDNKELIKKMGKLCGNEKNLAGQLKSPVLPDAGDGSVLHKLLRENAPDGAILAPVYVAQGALDEVVPVVAQREWVAERCAAGQKLDYREYPTATHYSVITAMATDLVNWTIDRFEGKPAPSTC